MLPLGPPDPSGCRHDCSASLAVGRGGVAPRGVPRGARARRPVARAQTSIPPTYPVQVNAAVTNQPGPGASHQVTVRCIATATFAVVVAPFETVVSFPGSGTQTIPGAQRLRPVPHRPSRRCRATRRPTSASTGPASPATSTGGGRSRRRRRPARRRRAPPSRSSGWTSARSSPVRSPHPATRSSAHRDDPGLGQQHRRRRPVHREGRLLQRHDAAAPGPSARSRSWSARRTPPPSSGR